jgi:hypothetical protein
VLAGLGFKSTLGTSSASWVRAHDGRWLVTWVQPYRTVNAADGSRFTVELRLSTRPEAGGDGYRRRLPSLLAEGEHLEIARRLVGPREDQWFGHAKEADVHLALAFCARVLPAVIDRFVDASESAAAATVQASAGGRSPHRRDPSGTREHRRPR